MALTASAGAGRLETILARGPYPHLQGVVLRQQSGNATAGAWAEPAAGDWDGDGREDILVGSGYGDLLFFGRRPDGVLAEPLQMTPEALSLVWRPLAPSAVSPSLADWDGDRRLDVILGVRNRIYLCRRSDRGLEPPEELRSGGRGLGELIRGVAPQCGHLAPCATDLDLDGDLDLLLGDDEGHVWWVPNERSATAAVLGAPRRLMAGEQIMTVPGRARVAAGDWNADGYPDLFIGSGSGSLYLAMGTAQGPTAPQRVFGTEAPVGFPDTASSVELSPAFCHWQGRTAGPRLVVGDRRGFLALLAPEGAAGVRLEGYLQAVNAPLDVGRCATPFPVDWDSDGDMDLIVGSEDGYVQLFERVAQDPPQFAAGRRVVDRSGPVRAELRPGRDPFLRYSWPCVADMDRDRDLDLVLGQANGVVKVWYNHKGFQTPTEVTVAGSLLVLPGTATVAACDYDQDGDMDLFVGTRTLAGMPVPRHLSPEFVIYLENEAKKAGQPPLFVKAVSLDSFVGSDAVHWNDADLLGLSFVQPTHWRPGTVLDFVATTRLGVYAFRSNSPRSAYPRLELMSTGAGAPLPILPPAWSCQASRFTGGDMGLLCGMEETGWVVWYPRSSLDSPGASGPPGAG